MYVTVMLASWSVPLFFIEAHLPFQFFFICRSLAPNFLQLHIISFHRM